MLQGAAAALPAASVTRNRKETGPAEPGLPLSRPSPLRDNPEGSDPRIDQLYGGVPPDALIRCEYGCPVIPDGSGHAVVKLIRGELTGREQVCSLSIPRESRTRTMKTPPEDEGDPETTPSGLKAKPCGSGLFEVHTYGGTPPAAARV